MVKEESDFSKVHRWKTAYGLHCKSCMNKKWNDYAHARGEYRPLEKATDSSVYLGIYIAERVLSNYFENIQRMPANFRGYDFICKNGHKIDVKSAVVGKNKTWEFAFAKNKIADYFLCLAFDNRHNLNPQHLWLIPGRDVNNITGTSIGPSTLGKWEKYHVPLDKVINACDALKGGI